MPAFWVKVKVPFPPKKTNCGLHLLCVCRTLLTNCRKAASSMPCVSVALDSSADRKWCFFLCVWTPVPLFTLLANDGASRDDVSFSLRLEVLLVAGGPQGWECSWSR